MAKSLGKQRYLYEGFYPDGSSAIAIRCEFTVYERKDGSLYVRPAGKNLPLIRRPDGSLYMKGP